jgi:hypothetical protein
VLALLALSATQVAYGALAGPILGTFFASDPGHVFLVGLLRAVVAGGVVTLAAWGLAFVAFASAVGVASGHPWGWRLGLAASVPWLLSGCVPLAVLVIAVLLHPDVRPPVVLRAPAPPELPDVYA